MAIQLENLQKYQQQLPPRMGMWDVPIDRESTLVYLLAVLFVVLFGEGDYNYMAVMALRCSAGVTFLAFLYHGRRTLLDLSTILKIPILGVPKVMFAKKNK